MTTETKTFRGAVKSFALDDLQVKAVADDFTFEGWANTATVDRYNEVVEPSAFVKYLDRFRANPIMLKDHDPRRAIGTFPHVEVRETGLWVEGRLGHGWEDADEARKQVEQKVLRAMSIGFRETDVGHVDKQNIYHITGLELLEISLVSIPANQDAVFSMDTDGKLLDIELLSESATQPRGYRALAAQVATLSDVLAQLRAAPDATVREQITRLETALRGRDAEVRDLAQAVATLLEAQAERLTSEQAALDERLDVLGRVQS